MGDTIQKAVHRSDVQERDTIMDHIEKLALLTVGCRHLVMNAAAHYILGGA